MGPDAIDNLDYDNTSSSRDTRVSYHAGLVTRFTYSLEIVLQATPNQPQLYSITHGLPHVW